MLAAAPDFVGKVDFIVSSPPFISNGQLANGSADYLELEPRAAFDAGPHGISIHERLVREGAGLLRPGTGRRSSISSVSQPISPLPRLRNQSLFLR